MLLWIYGQYRGKSFVNFVENVRVNAGTMHSAGVISCGGVLGTFSSIGPAIGSDA